MANGMSIPSFMYGTAWKEDRTEELTRLAIEAGFRAIDTANQRRHYHEAGVGEALRRLIQDGTLKREEIFLQTKFTYAAGQDHRLPYDPAADLTTQVRQSFAGSLEHLHAEYIDSYILHGPMYRRGLSEGDIEVWRAMEAIQKSGVAKLIGASNMEPDQLEALLKIAEVKPAFVQNRCFARDGWDKEMRGLCRANGIIYQGFSLLTANAAELNQPVIHQIARKHRSSIPQIVFNFAIRVGMIPLMGTTSQQHMREDLRSPEIELTGAEIETIEKMAV